MFEPKYISADQVSQVLTWPLVNAAVEEALKATGRSQPSAQEPKASFAVQPARSVTVCGDPNKLLLTMPGFMGNHQVGGTAGRNTLACKVVTSFSGNQQLTPPLSNILANILLFNTNTGALQSVMDGTQITAWRTAAASLVATKYLYLRQFPEHEANTKPLKVAIIGCGVQGQSHALGMCETFNVVDIYLWNRTKVKADLLASKLRERFPKTLQVHVSATPQEALQHADVICVGTYSPNALIDYSMLKQGQVHINTVGAGQVHFGEVAQDIYDHAMVYVDSLASAKIELKDLKATIVGEVGEVIHNDGKRSESSRLTIYQSMGIAVEDAAVAQAVYDEVMKKISA